MCLYKDFNTVVLYSRSEGIFSLPLQISPGQTLSIVVENQGRICYGPELADRWCCILLDISSHFVSGCQEGDPGERESGGRGPHWLAHDRAAAG